MTTENNKKQFCCEKCNFRCFKNSDWLRHIGTDKHIYRHNENQIEITENEFKCICNKKFITNSGLWKHKQKCKEYSKSNNTEITPKLVMKLIKDNKELTEIVMEQSKQILELSKNNK